jgi:hypothetical protein
MKITQCEYCGDDLGGEVDKWPGELVVCDKRKCQRWAREEELGAREEAHEKLDRDMGW